MRAPNSLLEENDVQKFIAKQVFFFFFWDDFNCSDDSILYIFEELVIFSEEHPLLNYLSIVSYMFIHQSKNLIYDKRVTCLFSSRVNRISAYEFVS